MTIVPRRLWILDALPIKDIIQNVKGVSCMSEQALLGSTAIVELADLLKNQPPRVYLLFYPGKTAFAE